MSEEKAMESIKRNMMSVIEFLGRNSIENDFGLKALQFLENHIDEHRDEFSEPVKDTYYLTVGSYLGECLCRAYDGKWIKDEQFGWGVSMYDGKLIAFPFSKVSKWLESGTTGDSFVSIFTSTPGLLRHLEEKDKKQE
jgi:hypothetical protein